MMPVNAVRNPSSYIQSVLPEKRRSHHQDTTVGNDSNSEQPRSNLQGFKRSLDNFSPVVTRGCFNRGSSPKLAGHAGVVVSDVQAAQRGWRRNDKKGWRSKQGDLR